jgi:hypothetical protein
MRHKKPQMLAYRRKRSWSTRKCNGCSSSQRSGKKTASFLCTISMARQDNMRLAIQTWLRPLFRVDSPFQSWMCLSSGHEENKPFSPQVPRALADAFSVDAMFESVINGPASPSKSNLPL